MFSVDDFVSKYKTYNSEELVEMDSNKDGYSSEAQEALEIVIQSRGGLEKLLQELKQRSIIENERIRIMKEAKEFGNQGVDISLIKTTANSKILPIVEVHSLIDNTYREVVASLEDKKIKPRTIIGSFLGGLIASIIGGIFWGAQMIYSGRIFYIFLIGLALLSYGIIRLFTKQTKQNTVVLIATVGSVLLALLLGQFLYDIFGNQHP